MKSRDKVERKYIQEQRPNKFYCYNQNMVLSTEWIRTWPSTGLVSELKNSGGPRLFEWQLFFRVRWYSIVLIKKNAMSLCLFWLLEEILSMQIFLNIPKKADYPRTMQEFEISHKMFVTKTQNIIRYNLNTGVFRIPSSI